MANHTEKSIIDHLHRKYEGNSKFRIPNVYLFNWESDFFLIKETGYCYEFEIKISKSDFKRDASKTEKISVLKTGYYHREIWNHVMEENGTHKSENNRLVREITGQKQIEAKRPNKFYYVVPEGMITKFDVPAYSGLIYVNESGRMTTVKEAPFLHKEKLDLYKELCNKFYWYWLNQCDKTTALEREIEKLKIQPTLF